MFGSLRFRLFASYVILIVLSLLVAAFALTFLLREYQTKLAQAQLDEIAIPLIYQMKDASQAGRSPQEMLARLAQQADELNVRILLISSNGKIVLDSGSDGSMVGEQFQVPIDKLSTNQRQLYRGTYRDSRGHPFVYTALLAKAVLNSANPRPGVITLAFVQPLGGFARVAGDLLSSLLISACLVLVVALLLGFGLTRWMLRPVGRFAHASAGIAQGDYSQRVPLSGPTEFKHLAETLNLMALEVGRSRQALRDFLANVAHEFKTPLTSIRGFVQAQLDGTVPDEAGRQKSLRIMDAEAARLQRLVAELLDLSRLEARQVKMQREPVRLSELVGQSLEIFAPRAEERQVKLSAEVPPELTVLGDFDRLEQVLANLVDNSLKHVSEGGQISVVARANSGGLVRLSVIDNGPGIDEKDRPHLFERFYSPDSDGSRKGTGLGLAIAREIVRSHGGDITVESTKGKGTTFVVSLSKV